MTGSFMRNLYLPISISCFAWASFDSATAQCPDADWTLYAATGDVSAIEISGGVTWVAAKGGVIRIDVSGVSTGDPDQRRITDGEGLISTDLTALTVDGFGNVWVGTRESGVSIFDADGSHITDLSSFDEVLFGDKVVGMAALGNRVYVSSANEFNSSAEPEGGGFVVVEVTPAGGGGFEYRREGFASPPLDVPAAVFTEPGSVWFGTKTQGLWRADEDDATGTVAEVQPDSGELLSLDVTSILRAPSFEHGSTEVLWVGTAGGLQRFDGAALDTVSAFEGEAVLDLYREDDRLFVLAQRGLNVPDLFEVDLSVALDPQRIPAVSCFADTIYASRQVAVDPAGRIVVGTESDGIGVREAGQWFCPPPLGPHAATISDLALATDGTLYFGTGTKERTFARGVGIFDGSDWASLTSELDDLNIISVEAWPDGSVWFASNRSPSEGVVHRFLPPDSIETYHNDAGENPNGLTFGRNCFSVRTDRDQNLWAVYAALGGGLSRIAYPTLEITNFPFVTLFGDNDLLRDVAFDSAGRVWVSTFDDGARPGRLFVIDLAGTPADTTDDLHYQFDVANEIEETLGEVVSLIIDSQDRIWLAGTGALVRGEIGSGAGRPPVTWQKIRGTSSQTGGRNPLPYTVVDVDWDGNIWLGTGESGLVRMTSDAVVWTWFDQEEGCPLPDQSIRGLHVDAESRTVYVGTATQGIARIDLSGGSSAQSADLNPEPYPNPWQPNQDGPLRFDGLDSRVFTTIRIFTVAGELVFEGRDLRDEEQKWDGRNLGGEIVESGVYAVTAVAADNRVYEGMVAVIR